MSIVDKVKQMLGQHSEKSKEGVERTGDMFDERTGGEHADRVDQAQEKAGDYIDREGGQGGDMGHHPGDMDQGGEPGPQGGGQPTP
ncbi:antitoxin [Actinomadura chokoriensis]|uniref:Antitoxin n=1 Tax=Actinomadura chokoriensis TaxID=454156 RepID=A0ABV4R4F3_9ACTN